MKLSISNGAFAHLQLEDNLALVKKLGFENLEFNMKGVETENDTAIYTVKKLIDDLGLRCLTLHAASFPVKDIVEIHRAVYYGKISADFARRLDAPTLVVHSSVARHIAPELRMKLLLPVFRELKAYAEGLGLKLALENLSYAASGYGKNVAEFEEIFNAIDGESIGFTLDFCHATASGTTFSLLEKYHERLCNIHMSNRAHKPFSATTPQLEAFVSKLKDYRYDGPVTLELNRKCTPAEFVQTKAVVEKALQGNTQPKS